MDETRDDPELPPWSKQPGESPRGYHVFDIYRLMGPGCSVREAELKWYEESGQTPPNRVGPRFALIATKWRWSERREWFWNAERKRLEKLLRKRREETYSRYADLADKALEKLEKAITRIEVGVAVRHLSAANTFATLRNMADAESRLLEIHRVSLCDTDEDRKRRGPSTDETGSLPAIEDRLKPHEEPTRTEEAP